jgi:FkbM family methyltransferase
MPSVKDTIRDFGGKLYFRFFYDPVVGLNFRPVRVGSGAPRKLYYRLQSDADRGVIWQIFHKRDYDLRHFELRHRLADFAASTKKSKLLVVDAGANIGASAVYFSQLDPRIHVHAIEPEANNFRILRQNCASFSATAEHAALAETCKTMWLQDPGRGDWGFQASDRSGAIPIDAIDMDHVLEQYDEAEVAPYICKIDIEGGEDRLFSANTGWVARFPLIIVELHDWIAPGTHNSRNFLRTIANGNFDVLRRGENLFCFNNDILGAFGPDVAAASAHRIDGDTA